MRTFITGDRTPAVIYAGMACIEMLRALGRGDTVVTGDNDGVEAFVRKIAEDAGVQVEVVPTPRDNEAGTALWDQRHASLEVDHVVAIHADPHDSRVIASLLRTISDDERLTIRTPADLVI